MRGSEDEIFENSVAQVHFNGSRGVHDPDRAPIESPKYAHVESADRVGGPPNGSERPPVRPRQPLNTSVDTDNLKT